MNLLQFVATSSYPVDLHLKSPQVVLLLMEPSSQIEKLRLIVRYPPKKPPYVGIIFENQYNACAINQGWVNSYNTYVYQLRFQKLSEGSLLLTISQRKMCWCYSYIVEKWDVKDIRELITKMNVYKTINFGHALIIDNLLTPAKTSVNQAVWVLKVDAVEYLEEVSKKR